MKKTLLLTVTLALGLAADVHAQELQGKKVLYVNSYHAGYAWSDGIQKAVESVLKPTGAEVKIVGLDTYRQKAPEHLGKVSAEAKATIESWKPDVVIVSDDPAIKGIYAPFFKDKDVPFVFCGVNWDASAYGVPAKNITGMLEVCPVKELLAEMNKLKAGKTVGYLSADSLTPVKDLENVSKILGMKLESVTAKDFAAWKQGFLDLQSKVDLLLIGANAGISDWNEPEAQKFVEQNAKVVSGAWHDFLNGLALVSYNKLASEQGEWAAQTAIKIAKGAAAGSIPVTSNQRGELVINARIAKKTGVAPSFEMLQTAKVME